MRNREGLQDVQRVNGIETPFVDIVPGGVVSPQNRVTSSESQVLGCTILEGVGNLVEDFALGRLALAAVVCRVDVIATQIGGFPRQTRYAVAAEVQLIAGLPGALILEVEIRQERVGYPDRTAAVACIILITGIAGYTLVREDKGVSAHSVFGGEAPDIVVVGIGNYTILNIVRLVIVEVEGQRLIFAQRHHVVNVGVFLIVRVLYIGKVQRSAQVVSKGIGTAYDIDAFQSHAIGVIRIACC